MSASSRPTRRPRSRSPTARLSAVVDFPTPPLPEATAMTAAMPGISDCFDIGDTGLCGGLCDETCGTPCACRCGSRAGAAPGLRSAASSLMASASPLRLKTLCDTNATHRAVPHKRLPHANIIRPLGRRHGCALLLGGLVIQLDHHAIRVIDEDLPEVAA